ncbi:MAG: hypothetical protein BGO78_10255 [Chloroflexi bacterium 44-23]|nr:MAG: hypothetical protein BGO78_10255 [Chloroflexi bacterium 44-23]
MLLFKSILFLHVLSAIVAVGTNITYGMLLLAAKRDQDAVFQSLKTIRLLDSRLANPGYIVALLTGLVMVFIIPLPISTSWVMSALILYGVIFFLGIFLYTPAFRQQVRLLEKDGVHSQTYQAAARRGNILLGVVAFLAILIVFLMVTKPSLW